WRDRGGRHPQRGHRRPPGLWQLIAHEMRRREVVDQNPDQDSGTTLVLDAEVHVPAVIAGPVYDPRAGRRDRGDALAGPRSRQRLLDERSSWDPQAALALIRQLSRGHGERGRPEQRRQRGRRRLLFRRRLYRGRLHRRRLHGRWVQRLPSRRRSGVPQAALAGIGEVAGWHAEHDGGDRGRRLLAGTLLWGRFATRLVLGRGPNDDGTAGEEGREQPEGGFHEA